MTFGERFEAHYAQNRDRIERWRKKLRQIHTLKQLDPRRDVFVSRDKVEIWGSEFFTYTVTQPRLLIIHEWREGLGPEVKDETN